MQEEFKKIKQVVLVKLDTEPWHNPYHNSKHTEDVLAAVLLLANNLLEPLAERDLFILQLAALYHDFGHPGKTIRSQVKEEIPRKDLSNEEYAALQAANDLDEYLKADEVLKLQALILASTYGQPEKSYQAKTKLEKLLVLADVFSFNKGTEHWLAQGQLVLQEMTEDEREESALLQRSLSFIDHIEEQLIATKEFLKLDFYNQVEAKLKALQAMFNTASS